MADTKSSCFVISPIGEQGSPIRQRANNLINYVLRPVLGPMGFEVTRADEISTPGSITSQVIERVIDSDLVIADLTDHNPNVFYELALRHAVQKPYVQLTDEKSLIPFDIKDERTIVFNIQDLGSVDDCKNRLRMQVEAVMVDGFLVTTPIGRALQLKSVMKAGGDTALILQSINALRMAFETRDWVKVDAGPYTIDAPEGVAWTMAAREARNTAPTHLRYNRSLLKMILTKYSLEPTDRNVEKLGVLCGAPDDLSADTTKWK